MLRSAVFVVAIVAPVVASQGHDHPATGKFGTVRFANSCNTAARPAFIRAVALLVARDQRVAQIEDSTIDVEHPTTGAGAVMIRIGLIEDDRRVIDVQRVVIPNAATHRYLLCDPGHVHSVIRPVAFRNYFWRTIFARFSARWKILRHVPHPPPPPDRAG